MSDNSEDSIKVKAGDEVTFLAMQWEDENWEFDFPSILLEPVVQWHESGAHCENVIEDAIVEALADGEISAEGVPDFRGSLQYLKRVAREVQAGKKFPQRNYRVRIETHRFFENDDNILESTTTKIQDFE